MCNDAETDRRNSRVVIDALHPVQPEKNVPDHCQREQGARRAHARQVGARAAEGVLSAATRMTVEIVDYHWGKDASKRQ